MKKNVLLFGFILSFIGNHADGATVIFYGDGAQIEQQFSTVKGEVDILLPPDMIDSSLRIKPVGGVSIKRVEFLQQALSTNGKKKGEETLLEQKNRLLDRLKALETREQIFIAAAKSQSGKAPRKTKANPDPMQSIRQGTDFAIAQLESVYTSRRRTESELKKVEAKLGSAGVVPGGGKIARVNISEQRGAVTVRYFINRNRWIPRYDLRFISGNSTVGIDLIAELSGSYKGYQRFIANGKLGGTSTTHTIPANESSFFVEHYDLPVSQIAFGGDKFSFIMQNSGLKTLPAGDATIYLDKEYVGKVRFDRFSSGERRKISSK